MALDWRFVFAGASAVLMQVQVVAVDRRFGFVGAAAVLIVVQGLDRMPAVTSCHARTDIMLFQG